MPVRWRALLLRRNLCAPFFTVNARRRRTSVIVKLMSHIPNALSLSRVALSAALIWVDPSSAWFAVLYLTAGLTDIADGWLARRLNATSLLGARLDTLGDAVFYLVVTGQTLLHVRLPEDAALIVGVAAVALLRLSNLVLTRVRFGQWSSIHTLGNKAAGIVIFIAAPLWIMDVDGRAWIAATAIAIAFLTAIEETVIVTTAREYDVNRRGLSTR